MPQADGFECTVALPPTVSLQVNDFALAVAGPLLLSSPVPVVAVAVAGPPVVVAIVLVLAEAPELVTLPVPFAVNGAVTLVLPTVAELPWVVVALMVVGPPPAVAVLLLVGVTVWVIAPLLPSHSDSTKQWRLESADVLVNPNALLVASGSLVIVVFPVLLLLSALGETVILLRSILAMPQADGLELTVAFPPRVSLQVNDFALAVAGPLLLSSPLPVVAVAVAGPPVVVAIVLVLAEAPEFVTLAVPFAVNGAVTLVLPTEAELPWVVVALIVVGPLPAVAVLLLVGVTVWMIAPLLPSHSDIAKQWRLSSAVVHVNPNALLVAEGLLVMVVRPVSLELLALGWTSRVLWSTLPMPQADGFECTVALPPRVSLQVNDFALAVAGPLLLSSPFPVVAVAVAGPPVVVAIVLVDAEAPEFVTLAVPFAVNGAVTLVLPTVAELPWVVVALMVVGPPPAVAVLLLVGVTVWMILPLLPSPLLPEVASVPVVALGGAVASRHVLPLGDPVFAEVQVTPAAVLDADGDTVMLVFPVLLLLSALGATVMVLPLTMPNPVAEGLLVTVALPPDVVLVVFDVEVEVALPLPPEPFVAVDVAGAPEVVPVVDVVEALPSAKAGAATRMTTSTAVTRPVIADARDVRKRCLKVGVSSEFILSPLPKGALHAASSVHARRRVNLSSSAPTSLHRKSSCNPSACY
jgi:hypothetical protein